MVKGVGSVSSTIKGARASGLGDLTVKEVNQIQHVVNEAEQPLEVIGSAAFSQRRGAGSTLPIGKGPGTKSDIDYATNPSYLPYYKEIMGKLPDIDPKTGIVPEAGNPYMGPFIRFDPREKPTFNPAQK